MRASVFFASIVVGIAAVAGCSVDGSPTAAKEPSSDPSRPTTAPAEPEKSVLDPALEVGTVTVTDPQVIDNRRISCVDGNLTEELTITIGYNGEGEIGVAIGDFEDENRFFYERVDTRDQPGEPFYMLTVEIQNFGEDVDVVVSTVGANSLQIGQYYFGELNAEMCQDK